MPERQRTFPDPGFRPGDYAVEWSVGKTRRFSGDVGLAPRRLPRIELDGKLRHPRRDAAGNFVFPLPGQEIRYPRLVGRLRSNEEVVLIDVALSEWFPERFLGRARWSIAGLGVASVSDDRYGHVSFQITDADLWAGIPPLARTTWPRPGSATTEFSATLNQDAHRVWRDTRNGVTIDFGYAHTFSLDPYEFRLTFAPVFDLHSRQPITLDDWRDQRSRHSYESFATSSPTVRATTPTAISCLG
jgi:ApeA-like protein